MRKFSRARQIAVSGLLGVTLCASSAPAQNRFAGSSPQALIQSFRAASPDDIEEVASAIVERRGESAVVLRAMLASGSRDDRQVACQMLAQLRDSASVDALLVATFDADPMVKAHAVSALRVIGDRRASTRLRQLVQQAPTTSVLKRAMIALGKLGATRDVSLVRPYLAHSDETVRVSAAGVLAMLGNGEGEDILLAATQSSDPASQQEATGALGYLNTPNAQRRIQEILSDPNGAWKSYAIIAQTLQARRGLNPAADAATLEATARSGNRTVANWALDELTDSVGPDSTEAIRRLSTRPSRIGRRANLRLAVKEAQ